MTILFVAEDAELRQTASNVLSERGLDVAGATSITDAKNYLDEEHPAFVVIDEHVSGGSAFDLFNYILEYHPSVPAIIFADTMRADEMDRRPENVMPYQPDKLELALDTLADTIETAVQFQTKTLYPEPEDEDERVQNWTPSTSTRLKTQSFMMS